MEPLGLGVLCAAIGSVMATEAVKLVCGIGDSLVGRLMVFDALAMALGEALRAAGDTAWCLFARISLAWLVWLPLAYLVVRVAGGEAAAATWVMVVYFIALVIVLGWRFRGGAWRRIDLTGRAAVH